jgi:predicted cupin superfamily sugar epimerase
MSTHSADFWIKDFHLNKHIEGGWYSEVYRSALVFGKEQLPEVFGSNRMPAHIFILYYKKMASRLFIV